MTYLDLLQQTRDKFTSTAQFDKGLYNKNTFLGCAIGIHLPVSSREFLEFTVAPKVGYGISTLHFHTFKSKKYSQWLKRFLFSHFEGVNVEQLAELQTTYDTSHCLTYFLHTLDQLIKRETNASFNS